MPAPRMARDDDNGRLAVLVEMAEAAIQLAIGSLIYAQHGASCRARVNAYGVAATKKTVS